MNLYLPGATWLPVPYRREAGTFAARPPGYVIHVQQGNNSPGAWFARLTSPNRKFSTAWVGKDGRSEQYAELDCQSWAQGDGNPLWWSFETEGYAHELLTGPQIDTLARWHNYLGTHDSLANSPTHASGGQAWGGHSCPGVLRAGQRGAVIARAQTSRRDVVLTVPPVVFVPPAVPPKQGVLRMETIDLRSATATRLVLGRNVAPMQRLLQVADDGKAGAATRKALGMKQQHLFGEADYIFGPATASALLAGK